MTHISCIILIYFRFWVEGITLSVIGFIGILGNLLSLKILRKDSMRKTTFDEMLTHLLILDTMLVIFFLVDAMTTIVFESSPDWYKVLYPFVIHPGKTISMSATVFMVVAVSADRQRAICHPMLYRVRNLKPKGQLISKCSFGVVAWTKIPTQKFAKFCPRIWKLVKS